MSKRNRPEHFVNDHFNATEDSLAGDDLEQSSISIPVEGTTDVVKACLAVENTDLTFDPHILNRKSIGVHI